MKNNIPVYNLCKKGDTTPILHGTEKDLRTFTKKLWSDAAMECIAGGFETEEDFYFWVDLCDIHSFLNFFFDFKTTEICSVPIEDFAD